MDDTIPWVCTKCGEVGTVDYDPQTDDVDSVSRRAQSEHDQIGDCGYTVWVATKTLSQRR